MGELKDRIREAIQEVGELQEFCDRTRTPRRTLGNWLSGSRPKPESLALIASTTGVDLDWLLTGEGEKHPDLFGKAMRRLDQQYRDERAKEMSPEEFNAAFSAGLQRMADTEGPVAAPIAVVTLPRYDVRASAGSGSLVQSQDVSSYMVVGRDWLRRNLPPWAPANAIVGILEGSGDSMEPTIRDGDLVMLVRDPPTNVIERGGIFVLTVDHARLLLKRLQVKMNGDLAIISDNPAYETETIPMAEIDDRVIVHGQIFFAGGKPRSFGR